MADEKKDTVKVAEAGESVLRHIRLYVCEAAQVGLDSPPPDAKVNETVDALLRDDQEFAEWPLSNRTGAQSTFLEHILLKAMALLGHPIEPDAELESAYHDSSVPLPELDQEMKE